RTDTGLTIAFFPQRYEIRYETRILSTSRGFETQTENAFQIIRFLLSIWRFKLDDGGVGVYTSGRSSLRANLLALLLLSLVVGSVGTWEARLKLLPNAYMLARPMVW